MLVIAHKVVSKAEGRIRALADVAPSAEAVALAERLDKDPRHVQVVLDGTRRVLRAAHGVLICVTAPRLRLRERGRRRVERSRRSTRS